MQETNSQRLLSQETRFMRKLTKIWIQKERLVYSGYMEKMNCVYKYMCVCSVHGFVGFCMIGPCLWHSEAFRNTILTTRSWWFTASGIFEAVCIWHYHRLTFSRSGTVCFLYILQDLGQGIFLINVCWINKPTTFNLFLWPYLIYFSTLKKIHKK